MAADHHEARSAAQGHELSDYERGALQAICTEIDVRLEIGFPPSMEDLRMWKRIIEEALNAPA